MRFEGNLQFDSFQLISICFSRIQYSKHAHCALPSLKNLRLYGIQFIGNQYHVMNFMNSWPTCYPKSVRTISHSNKMLSLFLQTTAHQHLQWHCLHFEMFCRTGEPLPNFEMQKRASIGARLPLKPNFGIQIESIRIQYLIDSNDFSIRDLQTWENSFENFFDKHNFSPL